MSLILNALRKSEQERQSRQANNLGADLYEVPQKNNRRKLVIYSAIFIIANLILTWVVISFNRKPEILPQVAVTINSETATQNHSVTPISKTNNTDKVVGDFTVPENNTSIADLIAEKSHNSKEQPIKKIVAPKPALLITPQQNPNNTSVYKSNDSEQMTTEVKPHKSGKPPTTKPITAKPEIVNTQPIESKIENNIENNAEPLDFEKPTDLTTLKQIEEIMEEKPN